MKLKNKNNETCRSKTHQAQAEKKASLINKLHLY